MVLTPTVRLFRSLLLLFLFALGALASAAPDEGPRQFDVPAGDAIETLKQAAQQAGSEIMFPAETVRGVQTNAVRGTLTIRQALDRMLAGTALVVVQDRATGALTVARRSNAPPPEERMAAAPSPAGEAGARASAGSGPDEVRLPDFHVSSERDDSYVGKEALSTTRTGVELLDLSQSVKVINRAFIDDLNPTLVVDTLKYVGGGQAGNINFADDRFTMRGFNSPADIGDFVDGFRAKIDSNTDTAILERLEIIKGPSAIFVANGPVGGVINKVTKSPTSYRFATIKVQTGGFDADRAEIDVGGPVTEDQRLLYRLVLAGQYTEGYYDHTYANRLIVAPSLTYVFNEHSRITLKYFYFNYRFSSYNGLPWDERTGRYIDVDPRTTFSEPSPGNWRRDIVHRALVEYTNRFNEHLAMRLAGFWGENNASRVESVNGSSIPLTYVPGTLIPRSTTAQDRDHPRRHLQADLVGTFATGPVDHRLLVGGELSDAPDHVRSFAGTSSPIDPFNPTFPGTVLVNPDPSSHLRTNNRQQKVFALETLSLFDERLQLSLGGSRVRAETSSHNRLTNVGTPELSLTEELLQYGVVYKPVAGVSVFYGYNENFAPNFLSGQVLPSQLGEQTEVGVKLDLLDGRLSANVAYFDIQQQNVPVLSFPQTTPPSFVLVPGQTSKGVDADIAYKFSDNLDVVFTFALLDAEARSQANSAAPVIVNPVNNVAETTFGLWTRYKFDEGILDGLSIGVGLSYLDERAVTNNNNSIVYGWLDEFLLADLVLSYERGRVRYGLNIDNLFGTGYEAAVRNQSIIVPGMGRNWKASVTWKF